MASGNNLLCKYDEGEGAHQRKTHGPNDEQPHHKDPTTLRAEEPVVSTHQPCICATTLPTCKNEAHRATAFHQSLLFETGELIETRCNDNDSSPKPKGAKVHRHPCHGESGDRQVE